MSHHTKAHTFASRTRQPHDQSLQKSVLFYNPIKIKKQKIPLTKKLNFATRTADHDT